MMLGRGSLRFLIRSLKRVFRPSTWIAGVSRPHFRLNDQGRVSIRACDSTGSRLETKFRTRGVTHDVPARGGTRLSRHPSGSPRVPPEPISAASGSVLRPLTVLGLAVTLGLATALFELAVHFVRRKFINPSSLGRSPVESAGLLDGSGLRSLDLWRMRSARRSRGRSVVRAGSLPPASSGSFSVSAFAVLLTFRGLTFSPVPLSPPGSPISSQLASWHGRVALIVSSAAACLRSWRWSPSWPASVPVAKS